MLATAIIVFREVLEAALIVGIVLAASQGVARRGNLGGGIPIAFDSEPSVSYLNRFFCRPSGASKNLSS